MTRVKISIGILLVLLFSSIFSCFWINKQCGELLDGVRSIEELAENEDYRTAESLAGELDNKWEKFSSKAAVLIKYDRLTEIGRLFAKTEHLAANESPELLAELHELEHLLALMCRSETPFLTSVL